MDIESHGGYDSSMTMPATSRGPVCVQAAPYWRQTITPGGSEDCLLLDVLVPQQPVSDCLPVLVNVHGGGYDQGNSQSNPGYSLVNQSMGNLIYVSIQYRLDAFGFLSSSEIRENGVANAGLLDQRAALNWVQRNIRAFGGDPSKVTVIGGSAGGGSVMDQMILYGGVTNPPFRAAIAEYPVCWSDLESGHAQANKGTVVAELQEQYRPGVPIPRDARRNELLDTCLSTTTDYRNPNQCNAVLARRRLHEQHLRLGRFLLWAER